MMRVLLMLALMLALPAEAQEQKKPSRLVVYYTDGLAQQFMPYDVIVFDSTTHPDLRGLKHKGKTLLGYVSLGEAEKYRHHFTTLQKEKLVMPETSDWPGAHVIDIRKAEWAEYVVEHIVPAILHKGFDGIFLDTLDTVAALEQKNPKAYAGMREASVALVKMIRMHYPQIKIMVNRGFDILPQIAGDVDMVLAESIYSTYHFKTKEYALQPEAFYLSVSGWLKQLQVTHKQLGIYTLDYWPLDDKEGIKAIYAAQRAQGFTAYVASPELQEVVPEP